MKRESFFAGLLGFFLCLLLSQGGGCSPESKEGGGPDGGTPPEKTNKEKGIDPAQKGLHTFCPGAAGCLSAEGALKVGAAKVTITPPGFEVPRLTYYGIEGSCPDKTPPSPDGTLRCDLLQRKAQTKRQDCGLDGLCQGDRFVTRRSCSAKNPCPGTQSCEKGKCVLAYTGHDADGSEGDGQPDWFLDCGRDRICPCKAPRGQDAYFGSQGKSCLQGHTKNPAYKGPDADGSEGNGKFEGFWIAGFSSNRPMAGLHDDIWARVVVLETGETTVAVVSLDLVGLFYNRVEEIRQRVAADPAGKAIDYILISSTHNHEAPDSMGQWGPADSGIPSESGVNARWMESLQKRTAQAILQAYKSRHKATLLAASTRTGAQNLIRDSRDPVVIDDEMIVLRFLKKGTEETIATVVNWANHPESLGGNNILLSSDFPHYLRLGVEQGLPAGKGQPAQKGLGGVCVYLQGAVGGLLNPLGISVHSRQGKKISDEGFAKSKALGNAVAAKALRAIASGETVVSPRLSVWAKTLDLPVENTILQFAFKAKLLVRPAYNYDPQLPIDKNNQPSIRSEIGLIRLGPVTFFSLPGELFPEVLIGGYDCSKSRGYECVSKNNTNPPPLKKAPQGPYLKERIPGKYKLTIGLGNDELGYMIPPYDFVLGSVPYFKQAKGDHYEETNSLGPQTVPLLLQAYKELLQHVQ